MFSALPAILAQLQLVRRVLLVLASRVIFTFAVRARKKYYFSHFPLLQDFGYNAGAYCPAAFPDRKPKFLLHGYRRYQLNRD
jgi:hypothetical protein